MRQDERRLPGAGMDRGFLPSPEAEVTLAHEPGLLGGVTLLRQPATVVETPDWNGPLYRPATNAGPQPRRAVTVTAIPYYTWANRAPGQMQVWTLTASR